MSRKKNRNDLSSLVLLGERLRELRLKAGISQMRLAEAMGFNPAHGYKYILRLEKGLIPNPTIHTLASVLKACNATWQDLVDVLPTLVGEQQADKGRQETPRPVEPESKSEEKAQQPSGAQSRAQRPESQVQTKVPAQPKPVRRDTRSLREQLRAERHEERLQRTRELWARIARAEERVEPLLQPLKRNLGLRHAYLVYLRSCCALLDAYRDLRPGLAERELARLLKSSVDQGLDQKTLLQIQAICTEVLQSE